VQKITQAPADELSWAQIDNRKILRNALTCQYDCYPAEAIQQILG
jgi:hypothetical protein